MRFACTCGNIIRDQTDYLTYSAHFVADQDVYDACEMSDNRSGDWWPSLTRTMYQCSSCGRLWIDDHNRELKSFVPEQPAENILSSIHGEKWKRVLRGSWRSEAVAPGFPKGFVSWVHLSSDDQVTSEDWETVESMYRKKFEELKEQGILRDALLTKNGEQIHSWSIDAKTQNGGESGRR